MVRFAVSRFHRSGTNQPYEVGPGQTAGTSRAARRRLSRRSATPQKPLRTDEPVTQIDKLDPRRVTADRGRAPGESRPPGVGCSRSRRVGSVSPHSVVGPPQSQRRWSAPCPSNRRPIPIGFARDLRSPARGPIQPWQGSDRCRSETEEVEPQTTSRQCGRRDCPSSAVQLPEPGRSSPHRDCSFFCLSKLCVGRGAVVGVSAQPFRKKRWRSKARCWRHR